MSMPLHDLENTVLSLPAEERAHLLERLIASFEPRSDAQRAWLELATERREQVRTGVVKLVPGVEALARVRKQIA